VWLPQSCLHCYVPSLEAGPSPLLDTLVWVKEACQCPRKAFGVPAHGPAPCPHQSDNEPPPGLGEAVLELRLVLQGPHDTGKLNLPCLTQHAPGDLLHTCWKSRAHAAAGAASRGISCMSTVNPHLDNSSKSRSCSKLQPKAATMTQQPRKHISALWHLAPSRGQ
jgi:hypothetical protein